MQEWLIFSSSKNMFSNLRGKEINEKKKQLFETDKKIQKECRCGQVLAVPARRAASIASFPSRPPTTPAATFASRIEHLEVESLSFCVWYIYALEISYQKYIQPDMKTALHF